MAGGYDRKQPARLMVEEIIANGVTQRTGVTGWTGQFASARYNSWATPIAPNTSSVVNLYAPTSSAAQTLTTFTAQPDYPRVLRVAAASSNSGNVVVTGTNQWGESITDTIVFGASKITNGVKAFKTVTSIVIPATVPSTSAPTYGIGLANLFGLDRKVASVAAVIRGAVNGTAETTAPIVETVGYTASFTTAATSSAGALVEIFFMAQDTTHA